MNEAGWIRRRSGLLVPMMPISGGGLTTIPRHSDLPDVPASVNPDTSHPRDAAGGHSSHAGTHQPGGTDQVTGIAPAAHAATHSGGSDPIPFQTRLLYGYAVDTGYTNSAAETEITPTAYNWAAGTFSGGSDVVFARIVGEYGATAGANSLTFRIRWTGVGGTLFATSDALAFALSDLVAFDVEVFLRPFSNTSCKVYARLFIAAKDFASTIKYERFYCSSSNIAIPNLSTNAGRISITTQQSTAVNNGITGICSVQGAYRT